MYLSKIRRMPLIRSIHPKRIRKYILPNKQERKAWLDFLFLKRHGVETKLGYVILLGRPIIYKHPDARIIIGHGVTIVSTNKWLNHAGINHQTIIAAESPGAEIKIGNNVGISGSSIMAVEKIDIGDGSLLGANSNIWDTDSHFVESNLRAKQTSISEAPHSPIIIGKNCWIGGNSTILKGVHLGDESVVGAMSLVTKGCPPKTTIAGIPAKEIYKVQREKTV